jgi:peroxiredoxin
MKIVMIFLFMIYLSVCIYAQETETPEGTPAPNFILENIEGDLVELNELIGEGPILLSFWATWCKPCVEELVHFQKIYSENEPKGLQMLGISTDSERSVAKVKPFIKTKNYTFTVLLDTNSEVARLYYARAVPYTVIIDKNGSIVYSHLGYKKGDELKVKEIINRLIKN